MSVTVSHFKDLRKGTFKRSGKSCYFKRNEQGVDYFRISSHGKEFRLLFLNIGINMVKFILKKEYRKNRSTLEGSQSCMGRAHVRGLLH